MSQGFCHGAFLMKFHVARDGAIMGEFEEQNFRNKVFSGEIRPSDLYWIPGFNDWRPVSEFRITRKTEPIVLDDGTAVPPAIRKPRQRSAPAIALICISVLALIFVIGMMTGKFRSGGTQHARIEAKTAAADGQIRIGMSANEVVSLLGQPTKIQRVPGTKKEQWIYENSNGPVILHFENGVLRRFHPD
jgi:hypothetical protein